MTANTTSQTAAMQPAASEPALHFVSCPGGSQSDAQNHRMAYWSWGDVANPKILVCVHGLTRQGRDFDVLARGLSDTYREIGRAHV